MAEPSRDIDSLLEQALALIEGGRLAESVAPLERARSLRPKHDKTLNILGMVRFRLQHFREAEDVYRTLVAANPQVHALHLNLGLIYLKLDRLNEAEAHLTKALSLSPRHAKTMQYLGLAYEKLGDTRRALEFYDKGGAVPQADKLRRATGAAQSVSAVPRRPPATDVDTVKMRAVQARGEEESVLEEAPAEDTQAGGGIRLSGYHMGAAPRGVSFHAKGQTAEISVSSAFTVPAGKVSATAGWFRSAHATFSAKILTLEGKGRLLLSAPPDHACYTVGGEMKELFVAAEALLGASGELKGAERTLGEHAFYVFSGEGFVVVRARTAPVIIALEPLPFHVPLPRAVAWSAEQIPEIAARSPLFPSKDALLRFVSPGAAVLADL